MFWVFVSVAVVMITIVVLLEKNKENDVTIPIDVILGSKKKRGNKYKWTPEDPFTDPTMSSLGGNFFYDD
jgi:hypothetical protein